MRTDWPSLSGKDTAFWAHEWDKHGTCAAPVLSGEKDFFTATLDLHGKIPKALLLPGCTMLVGLVSHVMSRELSALHCLARITHAAGIQAPLCRDSAQLRHMCFWHRAEAFSIDAALADAGIDVSAGGTFPAGDIFAALQDAFGVPPVLTCTAGRLSEVYLCVDRGA